MSVYPLPTNKGHCSQRAKTVPGAEWASGALTQLKTNFRACEITLSLLLTYLNLQLSHSSNLPVSCCKTAARQEQYNPTTLHSMDAGLTSPLRAEWHRRTGAWATLAKMTQPHLDMLGAQIHSSRGKEKNPCCPEMLFVHLCTVH